MVFGTFTPVPMPSQRGYLATSISLLLGGVDDGHLVNQCLDHRRVSERRHISEARHLALHVVCGGWGNAKGGGYRQGQRWRGRGARGEGVAIQRRGKMNGKATIGNGDQSINQPLHSETS